MMILVIDDEQMIRNLAQKILAKANYEVILAESGEEGLALFRDNQDKVKLAIIDMSMPGLSGTETLRELRKIDPELTGIISTGHAMNMGDLPDDLRDNTHFLIKPYRASEMIEIIGMYISAKSPSGT